ncbi:ABC transporter substrate-binding protein [Alkalihalobacillus alcalophilus ATCC 27647 = CGMCC 1.3604]|uniref:Maltodextrin-binding protein n=1 Tax=Alkalihalobacillus alcalophilus ATCC 27647 = CGMCC 1.3604 TaxID=1218173 RepID=A0A094YV17_ALKAL|nr:extracellular solute-binding protein [Alkalihalobacillus alcalophilus]KGA97357.1 ABC transporter substrate-binding protein [Alkalihalobacillus alcalophilus ATCC 27647 = CGMCC 1.3604]MED1562102.1 extracellular solute-binding protein [Alkalihalobacillus alcalophilus]THG90841.1 ABC transporter substrate-binding protein [Alkalihalobacillus alcalophilus ATCC 27647 = CGMCC 1.3604]
MKKVLGIAITLFLVLLLAACGPDRDETGGTDSNGSGDEPATEGEKPDVLTMWVNEEDDQLDAYEEIVAKFEEEHGIAVEITPFSMVDQLAALTLDAPAGNGPDLYFQPNDMVGQAYLEGLAAELTLTDDQLAGYPEGAVHAFSYEGIQLGIPAVTETYALYYNTDLVPEAPQTIEDIEQIAADLTNAANDEYGFLMEATNFYFLYPFLAADGGYVFNEDADGAYDDSDIGLANAGAVTGAERVQNWFTEGYIPTGINGDIMNGLFEDGKVGAVISGPWNISAYSQALGDKLAVAPLPTINGENLQSFSGVKGWMVNEYTENLDWAVELALFITNAENSLTYFEYAAELPARTDVEIDDEILAAFADQAVHAVPMPNIPAMSQVWEPMAEAFEFISQGENVQEVLEEAVEQIHEDINLQKGN